jgi:hypothetical protein
MDGRAGEFNRSTQHLLFFLIGQEIAQMTQTKERGLSASQKKALWERWKRGQSLNDIARALAKHRGSTIPRSTSNGWNSIRSFVRHMDNS